MLPVTLHALVSTSCAGLCTLNEAGSVLRHFLSETQGLAVVAVRVWLVFRFAFEMGASCGSLAVRELGM